MPTYGYAMKDVEGNILLWTLTKYEEDSYRIAAMNHLDFNRHDCVKVEIREVP